jgi:hypothetical protein
MAIWMWAYAVGQGTKVKITKRQLRKFVKETVGSRIIETSPTFGMRPGDAVRHKDDHELGTGLVVAKGSKRDRTVLVKWAAGFTRSHDPAMLIKENKMKITKSQLKRIIKEEITGYDPQDFMAQITAIDNELGELNKGMPFRSAGVRMAMEKVKSAMYELGHGMRKELKATETLGD